MLRLLLQHWQSYSQHQYKPPKRELSIPVPDAFSQDVTKVNPIFQDDSDAASTNSYIRARREILAEVHHDADDTSLGSLARSSSLSPSTGSGSTTERRSFLHSNRGPSPGGNSSTLDSPRVPPSKPVIGTSNTLVTDPTPKSAPSSGSSIEPSKEVSDPPQDANPDPPQDRSKAPDFSKFIPPPPPLPTLNMTLKPSPLATISEKSDSGNSRPSTPVRTASPAPVKEPIRVSDLFKASIGETRNLKPSEVLRRQRGLREASVEKEETEVKKPIEDSSLTRTLVKKPLEEAVVRDEVDTQPKMRQGNGIATPIKDMDPPKPAMDEMTVPDMTVEAPAPVKTQVEPKTLESKITTTVGPSAHGKKKGGVTRGDQVPSDEGHSSSSFHSSGSGSKKDSSGEKSRRPTKQHPCRNCTTRAPLAATLSNGGPLGPITVPNGKAGQAVSGSRQRLSPVGLAKFDDYYLAAIREARKGRSSDSLSDSLATYDRMSDRKFCKGCYQKKYRVKKGYRGSPDLRYPPEGSAQEASDSFFSEDYLARTNNPFVDPRTSFRKYRRSSWASCSCDQCSEGTLSLDRRLDAGRQGGIHANRRKNSINGGWTPPLHGCTCSQAASNRKVKFAPGGNTTEKVKVKDENQNDKVVDDEEAKTGNGEAKSELGEKKLASKSLQSGFTPFPWEAEDWQSFLRKKHYQRRRRRALYMGLTALVLVVLVGMAVGLVLVWLRRSK